jgi:hypothetical protein
MAERRTQAHHLARHWQDASVAPIRLGSDAHRALFCRMLHDTFNPYEPAVIDWPVLSDDARRRLIALPIWDIAVQTEGKATRRVLRYAACVADPLLRRAIELNGFEEGRHKAVLAALTVAYGIALAAEPPYATPRDPEWAFMVTGYSECIDSFFAFGLYTAARRSRYFPPELAELFEPIMQEECRHILFFVNWVAWHRRNLPWWRRPIFAARVIAVWAYLIWERIQTARDIGGGNNFTLAAQDAVAIDLSPLQQFELCLSENDRRLAGYDTRLARPTLVPRLVRLACRITRLCRRSKP